MPLSAELPKEILDPQRLAALDLTGIMDTPPEEAFDRLTTLVQQILGVPVAMVSLVDQNRQFFKSQVGLSEPWASKRETPLSHSFCKQVVINKAPFIVADSTLNPIVKENPAISELGIASYAGVPIKTSDDQVLGAFCVVDTQPHEWTPREIEVLNTLAEMVMREFALRDLTQKLDTQYKALQKAERQRDGLVHMVVHDLRTPLTSLVMGLQTIEMVAELDEMSKELLNHAVWGANSLADMVNTILDVSRAEAGMMPLECKPVLAFSLIEAAITQTENLVEQKALHLSLDVAEDVPVFVADEEKMVRVLVNLLGNSIRYTPKQGEILVSVRLDSEGQSVLWGVSDTGPGISPENLERIFEKFEQVEGEHRSQSTSGIGLNFCKLVVEAHGGRIWAESQLGQGSCFYFTLPLQANLS